MGTIPPLPSITAGENPTAAKLNQWSSAIDFWSNPPQASIYQTTTSTSFTTGTWGLVGFDAEIFDIVQAGDSPMHDTATQNSRLYFRTAGKYVVSGQLTFVTNATGSRSVDLRMNAAGSSSGGTSLVLQSVAALASATTVLVPEVTYAFAAGDYVELFGLQTSGGTISSQTGQRYSFLKARLVSQ